MIGITNAQDLQIALPEGDIEMKIRGRVFAFTTAAALAASLGASVLASQASATTAHSFAGGYSVIHNSGSHRPATTVALAAASVPACTAGDLGVWVAADQGEGAAGTAYVPLEFTNLSHHTCTLHGFPGVSAISSSGRQLGSPAVWDHGVPARTVTLAPGGTGYASLGYSDVITADCPAASKRTASALLVYPPGQTHADHALWDSVTCTAPGSTEFLTVRVIAPGPGVRGDTG
jgi:uncharacterized protein DUF4232